MLSARSPLRPFRHRAFAVIWTATLVANVALWMETTAGSWLMTALAPDPRMVALVQAASTLPMFLLGLPAGALADLFDRRRLLLTMELVGTALAAAFSVLVAAGLVTPVALLVFVLLASAAAASITPTWQAIVPQLVERKEDLAPAVALDSVSVNISRAIGPALAGVVIGVWGLAAPFALYAVCDLACIGALYWWRPPPRPASQLPPERFGNAIVIGLRHARFNHALRAALLRACGFFLFASAYWALLPLVAREQLGGGPGTFGLVLGAIGAGAIAGTVLLPKLKAKLGADRLVQAGTVGTALAMVLLAFARELSLALVAGAIAGMAWIAVLATLNVAAQMALPAWVRGRGLAVYATVMFGAMAIGSVAWGQAASSWGLPAAHLVAAAAALLAIPLLRRHSLGSGAAPDLTPSATFPEQLAVDAVDHERGPVLVTVEYRVEAADREPFLAAIDRLGIARRRNGTYRWGVFEDAEQPGRWLESFVVDSWVEYLRELGRVTRADRSVGAEVLRFHRGDPPKVSHFIGP